MVSGTMKIVTLSAFLIALVVVPYVAVCDAHEATPCKNVTNTSLKAIQDLCHNTNYQETCIKVLTNITNSTDTKMLVKVTFEVTIERLNNTIKKIVPLRNASRDPNESQAYEICEDYLGLAISDIQEAVGVFDSFVSNPEMYVRNIKSRLSGASTYEQTCIDSFEGAKQEVHDRINGLLKEAHELTINGLALLNEF